jgi:stage II sporulation protein M
MDRTLEGTRLIAALQTQGRLLQFREAFRQKLQHHVHLWSFLSAVVLCGLLFGSVVAGQLNAGDTIVLANAISHLLSAISQHQLAPGADLWWQRVISDGQVLALLWLFGVSVIGIPFIAVTLFLRAFSVGFSVGFTVIQFGWKGFLLSGMIIFMHQIISMGALLVAGGVAIQFSTQILEQSLPIRALPWRFIKYTFVFMICMLCLMLGAAVQAYIGPAIVSAVFSP